MKRILSLLLATWSILPMQLDLVKSDVKTHIKPESFFAPSFLGEIELYHGKKGFYIKQDSEKYRIKKYDTDSLLRDANKKQLKAFLKNGYLTVNKMSDGQFSLKANGRLEGGGVLGAIIGATIAKVATSLAGHGAIQVVALCTGPGYIPTVIALESYFGAAIEVASVKAAVAGGIAGGVATGPV
jgi:hypothetical protein